MVALPGGTQATRLAIFWPLAAVAGLIVGLGTLTQGWQAALTQEWVGADLASCAVLALLAGWLVLQAPGRLWPLPATIAFLALREVDFHDWFFEPGLLQIGLLTGPAPLWQKAIGLSVMAVILVTLAALARIGLGPFWRALRHRAGWAVALTASLVVMLCATQLDGLAGDLDRAGHAVSVALHTALLAAEEGGELLFALGLALAADLGLRRRL